MASIPGGKYVFSAGQKVNLVLTPNGNNVPPPIAGDFNLEVFTATQGTVAGGYQGSAFAPGGTLDASSFLDASSLTLGIGDMFVADHGNSDSITAGSGNDTIGGGAKDTIIGGTGTLDVIAGAGNLVQLGSAVSPTVNALAGGDTIVLGANSATVFAGSGDTITGTKGTTGTILFAAGEVATMSGAATSQFTVSSGTSSVFGSAGKMTIEGVAGDTISVGTGMNSVLVNALAGSELIDYSDAAATVFAAAGDTVQGNNGTATILFGTKSPEVAFVTGPGAAGGTFTVGTSKINNFSGTASTVFIEGVAGDQISIGNGITSATINALGGGESVNLGDGTALVFSAAGDTITAGKGTATVLFNDGKSDVGVITDSGLSKGTTWTVTGTGGTLLTGTGASVAAVGFAGDTITSFAGTATINGLSDNMTIQVANGTDSVWGGTGDSIGVAPPATVAGSTVGGSDLFVHSSVQAAGSVGFGTFDSVKGSSTATATVGTVSGGVVSEGFGATDFIFYQNETAAQTASIVKAETHPVIGGLPSTQMVLPDGTTLTVIGAATITGAQFK